MANFCVSLWLLDLSHLNGVETPLIYSNMRIFSGVSNYTKSGSYATQGVHYVYLNGTHCHRHATCTHTMSHLATLVLIHP